MATLYTIGHSTRTLDELVEALHAHSIKTLVDIRAFPMSRRLPHFNRESLEKSLPEAGIRYVWMQELGGRRKKSLAESPNLALRNESFRNYADYMLTDEFQDGVKNLLDVARQQRTAIMCAEGLFWRCHRRLVSDSLVANGVTVQHIMPSGELRPHKLTNGAVIEGQRVTYPGERSLFT